MPLLAPFAENRYDMTYEIVNASLRLSSILKSPAFFPGFPRCRLPVTLLGKGDELLERLVAEVGLYTTGDPGAHQRNAGDGD